MRHITFLNQYRIFNPKFGKVLGEQLQHFLLTGQFSCYVETILLFVAFLGFRGFEDYDVVLGEYWEHAEELLALVYSVDFY